MCQMYKRGCLAPSTITQCNEPVSGWYANADWPQLCKIGTRYERQRLV